MKLDSRIWVAGHTGLVGSSLVRQLTEKGYNNLILLNHTDADLRVPETVEHIFKFYKPEYVFIAAGKVGGIMANSTYPADFIYDNIMMQTNIMHYAYLYKVERLLQMGSSCIYPRECPQPMKEEYLMTGVLEPTNEAYAAAKIAGVKMSEAYKKQYGCKFISVMPTNLYGQGDHYDTETSHVLPALIKKIHEAKVKNEPTVTLWGTGTPKREFMYVDDMTDACIFLMNSDNPAILATPCINLGTGQEFMIQEIAEAIKDIIEYTGKFIYDSSKPDGMPRKLLDSTLLHSFGWTNKYTIMQGLKKTYYYFLESQTN